MRELLSQKAGEDFYFIFIFIIIINIIISFFGNLNLFFAVSKMAFTFFSVPRMGMEMSNGLERSIW